MTSPGTSDSEEEGLYAPNEPREEEEEEEEETATTTERTVEGYEVWEDPNLQKLEFNGKKSWSCGFCNKEFAGGWNATKALRHLALVPKDIATCRSIPKEDVAFYKEVYANRFEKKLKKRMAKASLEEVIDVEQEESAAALHLAKKKKKRGGPKTTGLEEDSVASSLTTGGLLGSLNPSKKTPVTSSKNYIQMKLSPDIQNPIEENKLTLKIADFIHSCGLPFSIVEDPKFKSMIFQAKAASSKYELPTRSQVAGDLLEHIYDQQLKTQYEMLAIDAKAYGLCLYGDGATVKRMPLINILASGAHNTAAVLEIVDCTKHMAIGGKKDARYIASLFEKHMKKLDPRKEIIDLLYFDGAANVQKAGQVLEGSYSRVTCLHAAEHAISLWFQDIAKNQTIKSLIKISRKLYSYFGAGTTQGPHAMFAKASREHNNGRFIGLIRVADTRMAGHCIAFLRILRLRATFHTTVTSAEFLRLKQKKTEKLLVRILHNDDFWNLLFVVTRAMYPAMKLLRLCDQQCAAMDKLYFFVRRTDALLAKYIKDLNNLTSTEQYQAVSGEMVTMLNEMFHNPEGTTWNEDEQERMSEMEQDADESLDGRAPNQDSNRGSNLGDEMIIQWNKRRQRLVHDYSIAGWILSPTEEIRRDSHENYTYEHKQAIQRLIKKLLVPKTGTTAEHEADCNEAYNMFWDEFECFRSKTEYYRDKHIWISADAHGNKAHVWHMKNSSRSTKYLGRLAMIVCSKILGIGSAERAWGDVKHNKTGKRSHLSAAKTKMQSTIYGAYCANKAQILRKANASPKTLATKIDTWQDEDFDNLGLTEYGIVIEDMLQKQERPVRIFRTWIEDWEKECQKKNCPTNEAKLLAKYGGLYYYDDNEVAPD